MSDGKLTVTAVWEKMKALGAEKVPYHLGQAEQRGYSDFLGDAGKVWYRLSYQGHDKFAIRKL